jgi:hypothetical protein
MTSNNHYMLAVSILIFAASFSAAHWLDSRKVFMAKKGLEETKPPKTSSQPSVSVARDLPRELLTAWVIASIIWAMFAIEHILGSCNRGPDGFSCLIGGNDWVLQTHHFGWHDALQILLFLVTFPVTGLIVGTATLWVLTGFASPEDLCDRD